MALFVYSKFKISIDPESKKIQGLRQGDVVRREYYDAPDHVYSLMVVMEAGVETVGGGDSQYFIGALIEGDAPKNGELLDFVRITSLFETDRCGALYLTASDSDSPYMDVIDGLGTEHSLLWIDDVLRSESAFRFPIDEVVSHPERLIISYQIRASKPLDNVPLSLGYDNETDGTDSIGISTQWEYKLSVVTIDYPAQYSRELCIAPPLDKGDWCEIKSLNVVRLSDISAFSKATKARVGRITGIMDPVFGALDSYGAYFQNLYATRNVNIAGTLTAGDEKGFASTFYVGKIHKNVIPNSIDPAFAGKFPFSSKEKSPAGIGGVWEVYQTVTIEVQSAAWRKSHTGQTCCFSIWIKSQEGTILSFWQDGHHIKDIPVSGDNAWRRVNASFAVIDSAEPSMVIRIDSTAAGTLISSPQMESGERPSLYQPTDGTLSMVEDYGAWFSKGGIGGTIQNPLLKLNEDGSISSRDGSFVINPDGTGHFASGRFRWNKETITLEDFTIRWENLSEDARENLKGEKGVDANLLDWVEDWNTGKTVVNSETLITPKIFAGSKNANGTLTGVALGLFTLLSRNDTGQFQSESINGVYGFRDGYRTFAIDTTGCVKLGRGDQSIRYNALTGKIEFGAAVAMQWAGATWIDANGIFTGTLSADTLQAITIDASQITAGVIDAGRIDVAALRSQLVTADAIEALTLHVVRGKIGCWNVDADSIFSGAKNNAAGGYTAGDGAITIGSNGIRGYAWRLDSSGAGALAGGNIVWDTQGNVTFGESVVVQWTTPLEEVQQYIETTVTPRLTRISATGIYTGTLTAEQVNAVEIDAGSIRSGFLDAARIDAGTITADKLDADSIRSGIINTDYINGLSLTFDKGTIAGWNITKAYIYKNNVYLGADGSIYNGTKWKLNNDGSGQIANGNISWDAVGKVTFSEAVSLNWTAGIDGITDALGGSSYPRLTHISSSGIYTGTLTAAQVNAVAIDASSITTGTLSADRIAAGSIMADKLNAASIQANIINAAYINGLSLHVVQGEIGGWQINPVSISSSDGHIVLDHDNRRIAVYGGGSCVMMHHTSEHDYGLQVVDASDAILVNLGSDNTIAGWSITPTYLYKNSVCLGADGSLFNGDKWKLNNDGSGSIANGNISWDAAGNVTFGEAVALNWSNSGDLTDIINALGGEGYPKLTQITSSGIYTGMVSASQISVDSALVVGGSSSNGSVSVRDAGNEVKVTLDRTGITAAGGTIGGWTLSASSIHSGSVYLTSAGNIYNGSCWKLNSDGSGLLASNNISWTVAGVLTVKNAVIQDATIKGTLRTPFVRVDGSTWIILDNNGSHTDTSRPDSEKYDNLCVIAGIDSGGWTLQQPELPWSVDQSGRRLCLTHYRYNNEYVSGYSTFTAPGGMYFYENGLLSTKLRISREVVELIGYGSSTTFFGWIVLNRRDLGSTNKNGGFTRYLAMGTVTCSSGLAMSIKYKTYDGGVMSVSRAGTGVYNVNMPWSLATDKYMVMLTGKWGATQTTPIYACQKAQYTTYFQVQTGDDDTPNDGSFNFLVLSFTDYV